ncbi:MAG: hypothetical protein K2Q14_06725 [Gammaproteobacteria bacterium]|nr:hypothetical protein [Gammaproteobacteria bacterium]
MIHPLFHPTTAILVDEHKPFLNNLNLNGEILYQTFEDPASALIYCLEKSPLNLVSPSSEILNPHRFDTVSVIVLNCSHPIQFIDKLKENINGQFVKIILVTDKADQNEAIALFSAKKIDKFFLKTETSLEESIKQAITDMQQAYFADVGQSIFKTVMNPLFKEEAFLNFFSKILQKLQICEYYFCDNIDSFILVDREGNPHVLVLRSKGDLAFSAEYARIHQVYSELVNRISIGRLIPFFDNANPTPAKMEDWIIHTHHAKKIEGTEAYYYAVLSGKKTAVLPCTQNIKGFAAVVAKENLPIIESKYR